MDAAVFSRGGDFYVSLLLGGAQCDEAGPFEDLHDAVQMARRHVTGALRIEYRAPAHVEVCTDSGYGVDPDEIAEAA